MEERRKQNVASHSLESEFVSYEQAVALKELGFDDNYIAYYAANGKLRQGEMWTVRYSIKAPLKHQIFRWFREKHKLYAHVRESYSFDNSLEFVAQINGSHISHGIKDKPINRFDTYEEAENAAIDKLIQLSKQQ